MASAINLETQAPTLGFPTVGEATLVIVSVPTQSFSSNVLGVLSRVRKLPTANVIPSSVQIPGKRIVKSPSTISASSTVNAPSKSVTSRPSVRTVALTQPVATNSQSASLSVANQNLVASIPNVVERVTKNPSAQGVTSSVIVGSYYVSKSISTLDLGAVLPASTRLVRVHPSTLSTDTVLIEPDGNRTFSSNVFESSLSHPTITPRLRKLVNPLVFEAVCTIPSYVLKKLPDQISITSGVNSVVGSLLLQVSTLDVDSTFNAVEEVVSSLPNSQLIDSTTNQPHTATRFFPGVVSVDVGQPLASSVVLDTPQVFDIDSVIEEITIKLPSMVKPPAFNVGVVSLNSIKRVYKQSQLYTLNLEQFIPEHIVISLPNVFTVDAELSNITFVIGPTVSESITLVTIPNVLVFVDPIFSVGFLVFEQDDTWTATVVSDDAWYSEVVSNDTWVADIGVTNMLIVSRDHIEITVTLKQNITTNYNVPAGSTVKAAIIHPTLPVTLLGPVTLVENTHWTAGSNEVTAEFDAGSAISSSTAILEIQVTPPNGKVKSFFSVGITVKQDTID